MLVDLTLNTQTAGGGTNPEGDAATGAVIGNTGVEGAGMMDLILELILAAAAVASARRHTCRF